MRQRIRNEITLTSDISLTGYTNVTAYIRQQSVELSYACAVSGTSVTFTVPKTDAMKLKNAKAELQLAATDSNSVPVASNPLVFNVGALIWEAGYGN